MPKKQPIVIEKSEQNNVEAAPTKKQRTPRILQTNVPSCTVEDALVVPQAIWDNLAGKPCTPLQVCTALNLSPTSSKWRDLSGASIAYGFTSGGWNAKIITLEVLGKRAIAPTEEGDNLLAIKEAIQKPTILGRFFEYYSGKKFPKDTIGENMLIDWGVPKERAASVLSLIKENGLFANLLSEIKGSLYITLDDISAPSVSVEEKYDEGEQDQSLPPKLIEKLDIVPALNATTTLPSNSSNNKVFISHGKNRQMVENLKELLKFGSFDPVVSVERETTAISVPEKVFSDMRSCCAGIIHIEEEKTLLDANGTEHKVLNENVLIEIGAAIALYGNKIILLCHKGISLPSNLQGLYRCEYDGDKLDYDATMKLLKTFNSFKK